MNLRSMRPGEEGDIAALIHRSTNAWYREKLGHEIFTGTPEDCRIFPETYEALDPGCCLVAEIEGKIAGSCFYHPRDTHVGLGIMNAAPEFAGRGVAKALLTEILERAGGLPVRLVSSAMNLDSYSLYTRAGFCPVAVYQDMILPADRPLPPPPMIPGTVRKADAADLFAMVDLESEVAGIRRAKDLAHFLRSPGGNWATFVHRDVTGKIDGWLASVDHPGCRMIGPGVMGEDGIALALIHAQLMHRRGTSPVFLVPTHETTLVADLYGWGCRNVELHFAQVHGASQAPQGVVMPSFLPESG
jgi:GNAT superfamily N-acetyltransferase